MGVVVAFLFYMCKEMFQYFKRNFLNFNNFYNLGYFKFIVPSICLNAYRWTRRSRHGTPGTHRRDIVDYRTGYIRSHLRSPSGRVRWPAPKELIDCRYDIRCSLWFFSVIETHWMKFKIAIFFDVIEKWILWIHKSFFSHTFRSWNKISLV